MSCSLDNQKSSVRSMAQTNSKIKLYTPVLFHCSELGWEELDPESRRDLTRLSLFDFFSLRSDAESLLQQIQKLEQHSNGSVYEVETTLTEVSRCLISAREVGGICAFWAADFGASTMTNAIKFLSFCTPEQSGAEYFHKHPSPYEVKLLVSNWHGIDLSPLKLLAQTAAP